MIFAKIIVVGIILFIVPVCIGKVFSEGIKKDYANLIAFWAVLGFLIMLGIFQLLTVPFTLAAVPFHLLANLYSVIIIIITIYAVIRYGGDIWKAIHEFLLGKNWLNIIFILASAIILAQMLISMISANYIGEDDAAYIVYSNDIVYFDSIFGYGPYTGEYVGVGVNKMTLTSWCVFIAYLSKISTIPVAIMAHTILPFILIGYAYGVYYLMARVLFKNNYTKVGWFLIILSILHIGGNFSYYTITLRLLQCQWHGKAVVAIIVTPFLIYYVYVMNVGQVYRKEYVNLIFTTIAAAGCTLVGGGLALVVVASGTLAMSIVKRRCRIWIRSLICCIPCALYCVAFLLQYTLTEWLKG